MFCLKPLSLHVPLISSSLTRHSMRKKESSSLWPPWPPSLDRRMPTIALPSFTLCWLTLPTLRTREPKVSTSYDDFWYYWSHKHRDSRVASYQGPRTASKWMHYQSQTWTIEKLSARHQTVLVMLLGFRKPLYSCTEGICHSWSSTRPGTSLHVTQFYQAFPHVSTASDKCWGEKARVQG